MNNNDEKMTKEFVYEYLHEVKTGDSPTAISYIRSINQILSSIRPSSNKEKINLETARTYLAKLGRIIKELKEENVNLKEEK